MGWATSGIRIVVRDSDILGISPEAFSPALARAVERNGIIARAVKDVIDRYIVGT